MSRKGCFCSIWSELKVFRLLLFLSKIKLYIHSIYDTKMSKTKTLIVTDDRIKTMFKMETTKNGADMSAVTQELWKQYIVSSVNARKARAEEFKKQ